MSVLVEGILIMSAFMVIMGFILGMKEDADKK